ncbi:MAG: rRNA cytosine-C5-methyltransferase [Muribaculum sp.]|nr:rRNA cytosine-C5-methyltransferase [Muribaculaceae bacterium]MCM1081181.1 rRNA cytosine-C5-methyltransferase [Muribaculum sp.]
MKLPEGFECEFDGLAEALENGEPTVSVRFNAARGADVPDALQRVEWCQQGAYLASRPQFTFDPALHQGIYYVQDASSMIHNYIVAQLTAGLGPLLCLDACAAPGGKTIAAIDALPKGSFMLANEYVSLRADVLNQNLTRWGNPMVAVSHGDTSRLAKLREMFNLIIADVPCSGEGMFRKDPEAVKQWTPELVENCAALQRDITANLWQALAPGGYMIYSTCTFNDKENSMIVNYMLNEFADAEIVNFDMPQQWGVTKRGHCFHFLPGRVRGEGLTVAILRKKGEQTAKTPPFKEKTKCKIAPPVADAARKWLSTPDEFSIKPFGELYYAQPRRWEQALAIFNTKLKMVNPGGICIATVKGSDIIPQQALAMSLELTDNAFASYDVDYPTAIAYLQRQAVTLPEAAPRGMVLLTYRKKPLGFVKNLGNRANNLYPAPWRILSTHAPESAPALYTDSKSGDETAG